jgi:hypothetical protein
METESELAVYADRMWEGYFIRHCDAIAQDGKISIAKLHAGLITPLHRYVTEGILILGVPAFDSTLSCRIKAKSMFTSLCESFKASRFIDERCEWIVNGLALPLFRPPRTSGAMDWYETLNMDVILPWIEHVPIHWLETVDGEQISSFWTDDDVADPFGFVQLLTAAHYALNLFNGWAVDGSHTAHAYVQCVENFARLNVAEELLFKFLNRVIEDSTSNLDEEIDGLNVMPDFESPAGSQEEAERRARMLIATDPGIAERMIKREWMKRIRCGAAMVDQLRSWQALPKRMGAKKYPTALHDGIADPLATSPAHDEQLARLIDEQAKDDRENEIRHSIKRKTARPTKLS